jgi:hypothetical protein
LGLDGLNVDDKPRIICSSKYTPSFNVNSSYAQVCV